MTTPKLILLANITSSKSKIEANIGNEVVFARLNHRSDPFASLELEILALNLNDCTPKQSM